VAPVLRCRRDNGNLWSPTDSSRGPSSPFRLRRRARPLPPFGDVTRGIRASSTSSRASCSASASLVSSPGVAFQAISPLAVTPASSNSEELCL
jgi:hypothetical protein